jgi:release factor glutamine methyltransferase
MSETVFNHRSARAGPLKRLFNRIAYFFSYNLNKRRSTTISRAAGFRLQVPPTVFHPRLFLTSEFFATFIAGLDLKGRRVADVGTGSGVLALAAAKAGAAHVVAIDVNPHAAHATVENARGNGLEHGVTGMCSDLLSAIAARPLFDVILSNPPCFPGEPVDLADRSWHAGPDYRDIAALFEQACERLVPDGRMYVLLSSEAGLPALGALVERARLRARLVKERSTFLESMLMYELQKH